MALFLLKILTQGFKMGSFLFHSLSGSERSFLSIIGYGEETYPPVDADDSAEVGKL